MMQDIEERRPLKEAVATAYGTNLHVLWSRFIAGC
jgi:hypothetical protein